MSERSNVITHSAIWSRRIGASQLAGQIYASAWLDCAAARYSAGVLGPCAGAERRYRVDVLRAAGRALCLSLGPGLLRGCPDSADTFDRIPPGDAVHAE